MDISDCVQSVVNSSPSKAMRRWRADDRNLVIKTLTEPWTERADVLTMYKGHFGVANLLHRHGAVVDVRDKNNSTPLYIASIDGRVNIMRWLLNHGADPNTRKNNWLTPLHIAATYAELEAVPVLLEHNADVNSRCENDKTPLHDISHFRGFPEEKRVNVMQRLLEYRADPNACDDNHSTPFHEASSCQWGLVEVARVLLSYGANVDGEDGRGGTPFQVASSKGYDEMAKLLLEHGAVAQL